MSRFTVNSPVQFSNAESPINWFAGIEASLEEQSGIVISVIEIQPLNIFSPITWLFNVTSDNAKEFSNADSPISTTVDGITILVK